MRVFRDSLSWIDEGVRGRRVQHKSNGNARFLAAILQLVLFSGFLCAQARISIPAPALKDTPVALTTEQTMVAAIPAKETRRFTITACAGCLVEVQMEQMDLSMPMAVLSGPGIKAPIARFCDAGIHSVVRIPFVATQAADYPLEIHLARPSSGTVRVSVVSLRPETEADKDVVAGYDALASAESYRRAAAPDSAAKAIAAYDQVIELAQKMGDAPLQQQALIGKTRIYLYKLGDYGAGLKIAEEGKALIGNHPAGEAPQGDLAMDAASWKVLSSAYYFLARYPEMIDATNRSLALYTRLGDLYWQGILEGNIASVYAETGDLQRALSSAEAALRTARQLGDADGISFSLATIASIHDLRGEYQSALDADEGALNEIGQHPYPDEEGQVWMGLGEIYDELDDSERERDALSRALPLLRRSGDAASESTALSYLSSLELREGHIRLATEDLDKSMEIAVSHKLPREGAAADLGKAEILAAEHKFELAIDAADSGLKLAGQAGEAAILAQLLQEEGDLQARTRERAGCDERLHQGRIRLVRHSKSGTRGAGAGQHCPD